jgi:signal transduction histidine kinase
MGTLGRLSAGLAHDFGNTISAIGMHGKLIADQADIGKIDRGDIDGVNRGVRYAQDLVDKLRVFGSASEQQSASPIDIIAEARSTVQLAQPSLKQGLQLELDIRQPSAFAVANKADVHRVLINFLYNANDAIGETGTIKVSVREEAVRSECASCAMKFSGRYVALAVSDNGRGVDPAIADRLFEPLITSKASGQGGGLGLSTVHGIVHRLGGHLGLVPSPGGGSCFSAYFVANASE